MSHGGEVPKPTGHDLPTHASHDAGESRAEQLEFDLSERSPDPSKPYYQPTVFPDLPPPPHPVYEPSLVSPTTANGVNAEVDKAADHLRWLNAKLNESFEEIEGKKATQQHMADLRRQRKADELKRILAGPNYNNHKTDPPQTPDKPGLAELPSDEAALEAARTQVRDLLNALIAQRETLAAQTTREVEPTPQPPVISNAEAEFMHPASDPTQEEMTAKYAAMSLDGLAALQAEAYFHGDIDKHRAINDSLTNRVYDRERFLKKYTNTLATYSNTGKPPVLKAEEAPEPAGTPVTPAVLEGLPPPPTPRRRRQHPRVDWSHRTGQPLSEVVTESQQKREDQLKTTAIAGGALAAAGAASLAEPATPKESAQVIKEARRASKPRLFDRIRGRAVMAVTPDMTREASQPSKEDGADRRDRSWTKRVALGGTALVAAGVAAWLLKDGVDVGRPNMPNLPSWLDFGDDNKRNTNPSPQPGPRLGPDAVPNPPRGGGNVAEPMQFSRAARTVQPGEGFYQTFQDLKIPRDQWPDLLQKVGPKLEKSGDAYRMPNGEWGISQPGRLSQKSLELIMKNSRA